MQIEGPIVVVTDEAPLALMNALTTAGAFPVLHFDWYEAPAAIAALKPAGVVLTGGNLARSAHGAAIIDGIADEPSSPYMPIIDARASVAGIEHGPDTIPVDPDDLPRLVVRLAVAQRVRTLDAAMRRRRTAYGLDCSIVGRDALEDASVLVVGRGRAYPAIAQLVGERVGLIGALSLASAEDFLAARDFDGIVIADGLTVPAIENFLGSISGDVRKRDLPIALYGPAARVDTTRLSLPVEPLTAEADVVANFLPLVRLHARRATLERLIRSLESDGAIDPISGLMTSTAFEVQLARAITDAADRGAALALARINLNGTSSRRLCTDIGRVVGRLIRLSDFGCIAPDGATLIALPDTDIRTAQAALRRIGGVIRHTVFAPGPDTSVQVEPEMALLPVREGESVASVLARLDMKDVAAA